MTDTTLPLRLTMYSNKASLKQVLETLPLNSLAVIAAELMHNTGGGLRHTEDAARPDVPEAVSEALDSLLTDILNVACGRSGDTDTFLQAVNWWYMEPGADSRKWWQRILGALSNLKG